MGDTRAAGVDYAASLLRSTLQRRTCTQGYMRAAIELNGIVRVRVEYVNEAVAHEISTN